MKVKVWARPRCSGGRWARCCTSWAVIPLDRSSPQGTVGQAVDLLRNNEKMWFAITPEGTRKAGEGLEGRFPEDRPDG